jgi:hypothetical protein
MDDGLKNRFIKKKIEDLVNDNLKPFPTILCERDDPRITEVVRKYCLFSTKMIPFKGIHNLSYVSEELEIQQRSTDYGDLYINVNIN